MKKTPKKSAKKTKRSSGDNTPKKLPPAFLANIERAKSGVSMNPAGRPKGSRNRFAEKFVQDFIAHWEVHGAAALDRCFAEEIGTYINAAGKLLPKDFNINMTNEANLERLLDKFTSDQLRDLAVGLRALGASHGAASPSTGSGSEPDSVH